MILVLDLFYEEVSARLTSYIFVRRHNNLEECIFAVVAEKLFRTFH